MRTRPTVPALLATMLALVAMLAFAAAVVAKETTLTATLKGGDTEVPAGDPDGSGSATITVDAATKQVCYDITVTGIADATASHIHKGAAGEAGPVVVGLDTDGFSGSTKACVTADDAAVVADILANPANYYVNVHTADFPGGAVRGQLGAGSSNTSISSTSGSPALLLGMLLLLGSLAGLGVLHLAHRRA